MYSLVNTVLQGQETAASVLWPMCLLRPVLLTLAYPLTVLRTLSFTCLLPQAQYMALWFKSECKHTVNTALAVCMQRFKALDLVRASFTSKPEDKAMLLAAVDSRLPATVRSSLVDAARAMALSQEQSAAAAASKAKRLQGAADAALKAVAAAAQEEEKAVLLKAADDAARVAKAGAADAELASLDYAVAVFRAAAFLQAAGMVAGVCLQA